MIRFLATPVSMPKLSLDIQMKYIVHIVGDKVSQFKIEGSNKDVFDRKVSRWSPPGHLWMEMSRQEA